MITVYNDPVIFDTEPIEPETTLVTRLFTPIPTPPANSSGPYNKPLVGSLNNSNTPVPSLSTKPSGLPIRSELPINL